MFLRPVFPNNNELVFVNLIAMEVTYAVDVTASSFPLRVSVTTVGNLGEGVLDVAIDGGGMSNVNLVAVRMGVRAACMADFSSTGDGQATGARRVFESDNAVDGTGEYALVGRAGRNGPMEIFICKFRREEIRGECAVCQLYGIRVYRWGETYLVVQPPVEEA